MRAIVPKEFNGLMIAQVLNQLAPDVPLWAVEQALANRDVRLEGKRVSGKEIVHAGQEIRAYWPKTALFGKKTTKPIDIVYEDAHVMLVVKPQGLLSQNEKNPLMGDTALTRAIAHATTAERKADQIRLCHRLDVQTGGLLLMAKDDATFEAAFEAFHKRTIRKFYICLVKGCPTKRVATLTAWLRKDAENAYVSVTDYPTHSAKKIATAYRVLEEGTISRIEVELLTGRTHQIRAQLAHIGHPILGDDKYGDRVLNKRLDLRRQQLWATKLILNTTGALAYLDGRTFEVKCPF